MLGSKPKTNTADASAPAASSSKKTPLPSVAESEASQDNGSENAAPEEQQPTKETMHYMVKWDLTQQEAENTIFYRHFSRKNSHRKVQLKNGVTMADLKRDNRVYERHKKMKSRKAQKLAASTKTANSQDSDDTDEVDSQSSIHSSRRAARAERPAAHASSTSSVRQRDSNRSTRSSRRAETKVLFYFLVLS